MIDFSLFSHVFEVLLLGDVKRVEVMDAWSSRCDWLVSVFGTSLVTFK